MLNYYYNEGQTLYLTAWEYNITLILEEIKNRVLANGGSVKPATAGYIANRSILSVISKATEQNEKLDELLKEGTTDNRDEIRKRVFEANKKEIEEWSAKKNDPVKVTNNGFLVFILDGFYYSINIDENCFFEHSFIKTKVTEKNEYSKNAYSEKIKTAFVFDELLKADHTTPEASEARKEAAENIYNFITNAPENDRFKDTYRKRVPNYYNNGYHYETITKPERMEKIDF